MKLFFDARYIRTDFHNGVSRYSAELGSALSRLAPVTFIICDKAQLAFLPKNSEYIIIHAPTSPREPFTALILNKYKPDVVVSPMQTMGSMGRKFKLILTLHDLIYYRHRTPPADFNPLIRFGWRLYHATYAPQRIALNQADAIATVSEISKRDIIATRLTKRPVIVVPNAPQQLRAYLDKDVVLKKSPQNLVYMGSFMRYKNVEALIAGMEFLPGRTLHFLSRISPARKAELKECAPKDAKIVFHGGVTDAEYAKILANDAVLVSASRDEGYGLPLAEATALGVPAVVSNLLIHREVAGEGALYFGPNQPQEFAERIKELDSLATVKKLSAAGKKHIQQFNWSTSATVLLAAIKQL
ncbi:MAG TPA: glycosyltransferase family 1 protein [Candidatus Saccharimonadales bacterium]|nr:glycosyltransferase family 1 protein [Candidatus Saccharimonadales bacterium]